MSRKGSEPEKTPEEIEAEDAREAAEDAREQKLLNDSLTKLGLLPLPEPVPNASDAPSP
jgi:hypothetical protein